MPSRLWPAEAHTNLPPESAKRSATALALARSSAAPVRMTAPVSMSFGSRPASAYAARTKRSRAWTSIKPSSARYGVNRIGERCSTSRWTTTKRLDSDCVRRCRCSLANSRCEVDEPTSTPTVVSSTLSSAQVTSTPSPPSPSSPWSSKKRMSACSWPSCPSWKIAPLSISAVRQRGTRPCAARCRGARARRGTCGGSAGPDLRIRSGGRRT